MQDLVAATSTLGRRAREELLALARLRGLREEFIGDRFARYPLVARRFDGQGLAAFLFFDRAERTADRTLLYLGPLVSRDGAYLPLFATLVERWVDEPRGFWALAEVESARVDASFRSVLPSFVISEASRPDARRLAVPVVHAFQHAFPHVHGFDARTFTTRRDEAMHALAPALDDRYRVWLFGCDRRTRGPLLRELHTNVETPLRRIA